MLKQVLFLCIYTLTFSGALHFDVKADDIQNNVDEQVQAEDQIEVFPEFNQNMIDDDAVFPSMLSFLSMLDMDNNDFGEDNGSQDPTTFRTQEPNLFPFEFMDFLDFLPSLMMGGGDSTFIEIQTITQNDGTSQTTVTKNLRRVGEAPIVTTEIINNSDLQLSEDFKLEQISEDIETNSQISDVVVTAQDGSLNNKDYVQDVIEEQDQISLNQLKDNTHSVQDNIKEDPKIYNFFVRNAKGFSALGVAAIAYITWKLFNRDTNKYHQN